nr:hypothetical protein [Parafrankia soli]
MSPWPRSTDPTAPLAGAEARPTRWTAEAAARAILSGQATATAKTGDGPVEMARMFRLAKTSAVKARTQAINQLKAVLVR